MSAGSSEITSALEACANALSNGDPSGALDLARTAAEACDALEDDDPMRVQAQRAAMLLEIELGHFDAATRRAQLLECSIPHNAPARGILLADQAHLALSEGAPVRAERLFREALDLVDEAGDERGVSSVPLLGALAALVAGRDANGLEEAKQLSARALDILLNAGDAVREFADTLTFRALLDLRTGDAKGGLALLRESIALYETQNDCHERIATAAMLAAEAARATGDTEQARVFRQTVAQSSGNTQIPSFEHELIRFGRALRLELRRSAGLS